MSEVEFVNLLVGLIKLMTNQHGAQVAGELVRLALKEAPRHMENAVAYREGRSPATAAEIFVQAVNAPMWKAQD